MRILLVALALCLFAATAGAQPYYPQPVYYQPVYYQQVYYQPGYYVAQPRALPILDCIFGPRVYFQPVQFAQPYPPQDQRQPPQQR